MKKFIFICAFCFWFINQTANAQRALPAPTNLKASATYYDVSLEWTDNSGELETAFEIYRDGGLQNNYQLVGKVDRNVTRFRDSNISPNSLYYYRVRAINPRQNSEFTPDLEVKTPIAPPNTPLNLSATVNDGFVHLAWSGNNGGGTSFYVERADGDSQNFSRIATVEYSRTPEYDDRSVSPGQKYCYRIMAHNSSGDSRYSEPACVQLSVPRPAQPTELSAETLSAGQIRLRWKDNADNESGFDLERSEDGASFNKVADIEPDKQTFDDGNLRPATRYWYRIRARNAGGASDFSNIADATTSEVAPNAPARLAAVAVDHERINLTWEDVSGNETGFYLEISENGTGYRKIADLKPDTKSYQIDALKSETKYYFRIQAFNAIGKSEFSNVAEATTRKAPVPDTPTNLTAVPMDFDLVQLKWSRVSSNATQVIIERSKAKGSGYKEIGRVPATTTEFADREILDVVDYFYRIKAINNAGSSQYSNIAQIFAASIITGTEPVGASDVYVRDRLLFATSAGEQNAALTLYNIRGSVSAHFSFSNSGIFSVSNLPSGIYIAVIECGNNVLRRKIAIL